jgi:hypothetical protein
MKSITNYPTPLARKPPTPPQGGAESQAGTGLSFRLKTLRTLRTLRTLKPLKRKRSARLNRRSGGLSSERILNSFHLVNSITNDIIHN